MVSRSPTFVDRKYLDRDELRRDVLRVLVFYWKRGYREATGRHRGHADRRRTASRASSTSAKDRRR